MKKTALNSPLNMTLVIALGLSILGMSACSSDKEQAGAESGKVMAVDRVNDAADLARKNAPEAEDMAFEETAPVATNDMATTDANVTADTEMNGVATTEEANNTANSSMAETADSATTEESVNATTENPNADKTAADGLQ